MRALPSVIEPRGSIALSGLQRHLGFVRPGVAPPASSGALGPFGPLGRSLSAPPRPDRRKGSALHALGGFLYDTSRARGDRAWGPRLIPPAVAGVLLRVVNPRATSSDFKVPAMRHPQGTRRSSRPPRTKLPLRARSTSDAHCVPEATTAAGAYGSRPLSTAVLRTQTVGLHRFVEDPRPRTRPSSISPARVRSHGRCVPSIVCRSTRDPPEASREAIIKKASSTIFLYIGQDIYLTLGRLPPRVLLSYGSRRPVFRPTWHRSANLATPGNLPGLPTRGRQ